MATDCSHLDTIDHSRAPSADGCEDCLAAGGRGWVHQRMCSACGHVGCCDSSPGKHATGHYRISEHPIIRSFEPGESWYYCYADEVAFELNRAPAAPSHG